MDSTVNSRSGLAGNDSLAPLQEDTALVTEQLILSVPEDPPITNHKLGESMSSTVAEKLASTLDNEANLAPTSVNTVADQPKLRPHSTFDLPSFSKSSNFFRNAQWCADGSSLLSVTEHASLEILNLINKGTEVEFKHHLSLQQPAPILSTAWFPTASDLDPASFCFVAAIRDTPIKLFDASDGRVRASYRIL
ncbi:hypothetical protein RSAG8_04130, partial [Rhizoctonia solani AG-8 WAC10335]